MVRLVGAGPDEALEEQLAERLVMAVQLAIGGDHGERRASARLGRPAQPWRYALAREAVGIGRGLGLEGDRR